MRPKGKAAARLGSTRAQSDGRTTGPFQDLQGPIASLDELDADSRRLLWMRQLYVGLVGFIGGGGAAIFYLVSTWHQAPNRGWLALLATFTIAQAIMVWRMRQHIDTPTRRRAFFIAWDILAYVLIAAGSVLDGGLSSPIASIWVLPTIYLMMGYSRADIALCGSLAIMLYLATAGLTQAPPSATEIVMQILVLADAMLMVWFAAAAQEEHNTEPPRLSRRLQPLRGLGHEHREAVLT